MAMVINKDGKEIDFKAATPLMDDEIRNQLSLELAPCTEQKFFSAYEIAHFAKYNEEFEI